MRPFIITTPDNIQFLSKDEIFVFGSNESGRHGKGAAKTAMRFGANYGQAFGLQGSTFGIPTVNAVIDDKLSIPTIKKYVDMFISFAKENTNLTFLVTEIGCGLAGHTYEDIAPLFQSALEIHNIILPRKFVEYLK